MSRPLLAFLGALTLACGGVPGGEDETSASLGFAMSITQPVADEVTEFQVSVLRAELPDNTRVQCTEVIQTCLSSREDYSDQFVTLRGDDGREARALTFPANLDGGRQDVSVHIPVGVDYAVVVEALRGEVLIGSACTYVRRILTGQNNAIGATIVEVPSPQTCDPRL